eukprot:jgi/Botrbrau1/3606/Bobra.0204s0003.1
MVYVCWPMWSHLHGICMMANVEPLTCVYLSWLMRDYLHWVYVCRFPSCLTCLKELLLSSLC